MNTSIFDLNDRHITTFGKNLFISQFICLAIWLTDFYLHVPLAMKGSLLSVLFVILGIIFVIFHLNVIRYIYKGYEENKMYMLDRKT